MRGVEPVAHQPVRSRAARAVCSVTLRRLRRIVENASTKTPRILRHRDVCQPAPAVTRRGARSGRRARPDIELPLERRGQVGGEVHAPRALIDGANRRRPPIRRPPSKSPAVSWRISLPSLSYRYRCWKPLRGEAQMNCLALLQEVSSSCSGTQVSLRSVSSDAAAPPIARRNAAARASSGRGSGAARRCRGCPGTSRRVQIDSRFAAEVERRRLRRYRVRDDTGRRAHCACRSRDSAARTTRAPVGVDLEALDFGDRRFVDARIARCAVRPATTSSRCRDPSLPAR